ncbi:MAG: VWA domain-containing protein [Candidatus Cloacimonetes bacterium]|nr:VWA domain-containing protein [Candidatus Cloacimonadota bacterium]
MKDWELFDGFALGAMDHLYGSISLMLVITALTLLVFGKSIRKLVHPNNFSMLLLGYSKTQKNLLSALRLLALLLLTLAVLRPKWGYELQDVKKKGIDIVVAVDVSQSMLARDLAPDRLEAARRKILDFLSLLKGDRVSLVAFAGAAYAQCPLTEDYQAFRNFLELLDTELIPLPGTSLADAIEISREVLSQSSINSRAILLFTDGEEHDPEGVELARQVGEEGIRIFTVGVGSLEGVPVPQARNSTYNLRDSSGNLVISRLNERALAEIAEVSGGIYQRISIDNRDLEAIYLREIRQKLEQQEFMSTQKKIYQERYYWLALPAFFMLVLELFLSYFLSQKIVKLRPRGTITLALLLFSSTHWADSRVSKQDILDLGHKYSQNKSPELAYNLGHALYRNQDYSQARKIWEEAQKLHPSSALQEKLFYSQGNASFYQGDFLNALESWQNLLKINPEHQEGKKNLELLLKLLQKKSDEEQNQNDQENQKDQQEQEQEQQQNQQNQQNKKDQGDPGDQGDQGEQGDPGESKNQESPSQKEQDEQNEQAQNKESESNSGSDTAPEKLSEKMSEQEALRFLNRLPKENLEQMKRFIRFKLRQKEKAREEMGKPARDLGGKAW